MSRKHSLFAIGITILALSVVLSVIYIGYFSQTSEQLILWDTTDATVFEILRDHNGTLVARNYVTEGFYLIEVPLDEDDLQSLISELNARGDVKANSNFYKSGPTDSEQGD